MSFIRRGCLPFKEQASGVLHEFLPFWVNITKREKTFSCSSEGSTWTSIASIKAESPRDTRKSINMASGHKSLSMSLSGKPQIKGRPAERARSRATVSAISLNELRDSRGLEYRSLHALLALTPKIKRWGNQNSLSRPSSLGYGISREPQGFPSEMSWLSA